MILGKRKVWHLEHGKVGVVTKRGGRTSKKPYARRGS